MVYKTSLTPKCIELIQSNAKKGMKYTKIFKQLKKRYKNLTYQKVTYHAHKVVSTKQKQINEMGFIEDTRALCREMTSWAHELRDYVRQYDDPVIKSKFAFHMNIAYKNFVELLKTPAIQTTQVNILQQQLSKSLEGVLHKRTTKPIKIPT